VQCRGLIAGGVDAILIETCQDTLQIKAAVNGAKIARAEAGTDTPIFVQVTVETTGTLLVGPDIAAAADRGAGAGRAADGPELRHRAAGNGRACALAVAELARPDQRAAQCRPAGTGGWQTHYPLGAAEMASWVERFVAEDGVNLIGGCCGTSIEHIAGAGRDAAPARAASARHRWSASRSGCPRSPACTAGRCRCARKTAISASASAATPTARRNGASCRRKATGTAASPWAASRSAEGSNALDICTAFVGRDEMLEMNEVITPLHQLGERAAGDRQHRNPGDRGGAEAAWRQADHQLDQFRGWREGRHATDRLILAKKFGAAVIALTIDEVGMAKTPEDKLASPAPGGFRLHKARPAAIATC
jgi:5-methyltetrahydrofolate--homocysteine methyltransferase